jgi:RNA polymerase sigma factor (sigma-70 family)
MFTISTFPANLERLIAQAKRGDRNALASVVKHFHPRFVAHLRYKFMLREADAEDLAANFPLLLCTKGIPVGVDTHSSFWAYYMKCLVNVYYKSKTQQKKDPISISWEELIAGNDEQGAVSSDHLTCLADYRNNPTRYAEYVDLYEAMDTLTRRQQEALYGFYFEQRNVDEIAKETGIPANTIKSDLSRARKQLLTMLQDQQQQHPQQATLVTPPPSSKSVSPRTA